MNGGSARHEGNLPVSRKGWTMKTKMFRTVALGALIALATAPLGFAMDHGSMNHDSSAAASGASTPPAPQGEMIRKSVVSGFSLTYTLLDMKSMMQSASTPVTHGSDATMKSHHLMVSLVGPDGKPATSAKVGYLVIQPDKTEVKTLALPEAGGFGADIDVTAKGDYAITTKIVLGDTTLVDKFVYPPKAAAAGKAGLVNTLCPITGGALPPGGVPERLTREYKGQKIGFCCDGCPESWDRLTAAEKDAALAKAKKPVK
jgi:hypothetical protein